MLDSNTMPAKAKTAARIGRPPKTRPAIPSVAAAVRQAERKREKADTLRAQADELIADAMRKAAAEHSLADIAAVAGVSKARVHQIVRSGR
jgi:AcrR family transcriptional regulator